VALLRIAVVAAGLLTLFGGVSHAQEPRRVGLTFGYPAAVGVIWHLSERIALRPEFSFSATELNNVPSTATSLETSGSGYGTGVSALVYLSQWDDVRTYVSPRITYGRAKTSTSSAPFGGSRFETEQTTTSTGITGSFGVQYTPNDRFGIFGEFGVGYTKQSGEQVSAPSGGGSTASRSESRGHSAGTRAGVGVVLYF
jgi:opacity protein-like surface antigen